MSKRREVNAFNIAFLDLLSGALGAVIILYIAVPKSKVEDPMPTPEVKENKIVEKDDAKETIIALEEKIAGLARYNKELQGKMDTLEKENKVLIKTKEELRTIKEQEAKITEDAKKKGRNDLDVDVGFKFKGKYIAFIIDVSGSMFHEDRIGQVKAGMKMLITAMGEDFYVDVLNYPNGMVSDFRPMWGHMKQTTSYNKNGIYNFLQSLRPFGATPTRSVLKHVLQNYPHLTDIVLLTDGAPTKSNSKNLDDINGVLKEISYYNGGRVQINAIGVGSDFIRNKENPKYQFLNQLTQQNGGFFVGF